MFMIVALAGSLYIAYILVLIPKIYDCVNEIWYPE